MMADTDLRLIHPAPTERAGVPNAVLGTIVFILTELMFFGAFISALTIAKTGVPNWPPLDQPRLPIEETALNTVALLLSGVAMWYAGRVFRTDMKKARLPYGVALGLGSFFVLFQGGEWYSLLGEGLTLSSSTYGSFFYMIVGLHALHVISGLGVMFALFAQLTRGTLTADSFTAGRIWWYFVVLLWPVLYWRVYLS